jgi:hypothetical protein
MKKRGSAHLEIILSFVIFVGFTFFLLSYLQPAKNNNLSNSIGFGLENQFFEEISTNLTKVLVNSSESACQPDEVVGSAISQVVSGTFYYVLISDEFVGRAGLLSPCSVDYKIGFIESKEVISNRSLSEMAYKYVNNYDELKNELGVPVTIDFAVVSNEYVLQKDIPAGVEVIAKNYRRTVLHSDGSVLTEDFLIKIW